MDCPGCGLQRSFLALLHGHLSQSLHYHLATIPLLLLLLILILHLTINIPKGVQIIIGLQLTVAILSLAFYIYKIVHHQIFY